MRKAMISHLLSQIKWRNRPIPPTIYVSPSTLILGNLGKAKYFTTLYLKFGSFILKRFTRLQKRLSNYNDLTLSNKVVNYATNATT